MAGPATAASPGARGAAPAASHTPPSAAKQMASPAPGRRVAGPSSPSRHSTHLAVRDRGHRAAVGADRRGAGAEVGGDVPEARQHHRAPAAVGVQEARVRLGGAHRPVEPRGPPVVDHDHLRQPRG